MAGQLAQTPWLSWRVRERKNRRKKWGERRGGREERSAWNSTACPANEEGPRVSGKQAAGRDKCVPARSRLAIDWSPSTVSHEPNRWGPDESIPQVSEMRTTRSHETGWAHRDRFDPGETARNILLEPVGLHSGCNPPFLNCMYGMNVFTINSTGTVHIRRSVQPPSEACLVGSRCHPR